MKISIITPTYNSALTLEETILSIIDNKKKSKCEIEYIIVDSCSTDATKDIIKKYKEYIDVFVSEKDKGISDAFNKGIRLSSGEIIGIINSDDMLVSSAINDLLDEYESSIDVYYGDGYYLEANKHRKEFKVGPLDNLRYEMSLLHPSVFVCKRAYEKYGGFDTDLKCVMDRDLLLRMYIGGAKFKYIPKKLSIYRGGGESYKKYFKVVIPESEYISIKYGLPKSRARIGTIKRHIIMRAVFIKKRLFDS